MQDPTPPESNTSWALYVPQQHSSGWLLALRPGAISKFIWRRELNGETPFNHIY